ncbi:hypothetical protein KDL01_01215 [Actinospica durhamensis]|uniref:Uncharacterized protein n=1 Tax=Actinospica durhamensis TaxID=1508375 RepID=A0A941EK70_9ACTN|nr:hypothetical protein [Actinospica durhamensis]MBR7831858.1 hypothetical protein [Actinospica durhamensis]
MGPKLKRVKCPDKTTKFVHRDVSDAYPLSLREGSANLKAKMKSAELANASLEGGYQAKIGGMLMELDEKNNSLMLKFRSAYLVFQGDPCCQAGYLAEQTKSITEAHDRLLSTSFKINGYIQLIKFRPSSAAELTEAFIEVINELHPTSPVLNQAAATAAIGASRSAAATWMAGPPDRSDQPAVGGTPGSNGTAPTSGVPEKSAAQDDPEAVA